MNLNIRDKLKKEKRLFLQWDVLERTVHIQQWLKPSDLPLGYFVFNDFK